MVYQRQGQRSTQNYLQQKKYKEWYTNAKANDQLKIIYNGKNIKNGIQTPRPTINSKLSTTEKI
jgi:hypothetical protein